MSVILYLLWFLGMSCGSDIVKVVLGWICCCKRLVRIWFLDCEGVFVVEFVMILLFMFILFIGMVEVFDVYNQDWKVSWMVNVIIDFVVQVQIVMKNELDGVFDFGVMIFVFYFLDIFEIIVFSVFFDGFGNVLVDWSYNNSGNVLWMVGLLFFIMLFVIVVLFNILIVFGQLNIVYMLMFVNFFMNYFFWMVLMNLSDMYYFCLCLMDIV